MSSLQNGCGSSAALKALLCTTVLVAVGACLSAPSRAAVVQPQSPTPKSAPQVETLQTTYPLHLLHSIDVSRRADVFSQVERIEDGRTDARLKDGSFASWTFAVAPNASGVVYPVGLGEVRVGTALESVGSQSPMSVGLDGPAALPAGMDCDLIDAQRLRIPNPPYAFIAACRIDDAGALTKVMLFDADGRAAILGTHPLRLSRISTGSHSHGASGSLSLLTAPDMAGKIYLQRYDWRR